MAVCSGQGLHDGVERPTGSAGHRCGVKLAFNAANRNPQ